MTGLFVQKPAGVWASSAEHRALHAVLQVKHYIRRRVPESRQETKWRKKLEAMIDKPVRGFDWTDWFKREAEGQIFRAEDTHDIAFPVSVTVPEMILASWNELPATIRALWLDAAEVRTSAEGLPFDPADLDAALATVGEQIAGVTDTLRNQLEGMMRVAMQEQEGQFAFARRLRREWTDLSKTRARLIAVTEWNRAASAATHSGYTKQGVQQVLWLTAGDANVCPVCEDNEAQGSVPINQGFLSGDLYPPAHPGCRCNIAAA